MLRNDPMDWFHVTLDSLSDAVLATDVDGRITFLNPAAERLIGESAGTAQGKTVYQLLRLVDEGTGRPVDIVVSPEGVREAAALARRPLRIEGPGNGHAGNAELPTVACRAGGQST